MPTAGKIKWDQTGEKLWETGVDRGVLYKQDAQGAYSSGYAWNGLTAVNLNPSGGETNSEYADNIEYARITSTEKCAGTIEALHSPEEFDECDGSASLTTGVTIGQQGRKPFGFAFRSLIGNDIDDENHGYKIHLIYGAKANPSQKAYNTVNESPETVKLSWDFTTIPVAVAISDDGGVTFRNYKPTAHVTIDSTKVDAAKLAALEDILYGKDASTGQEAVAPRLPLPAEVNTILA